MKNENQFPTKRLLQNTISAYKDGYIGDEQALLTIDFAAKLDDEEAQALLDLCKEVGVAEAIKSFGK